MKITVLVPCHNEEEALPFFLAEIQKTADTMSAEHGVSFEFLFINDGSRDGTLNLLREYSKNDSRVNYISFSRNFGKEAGIYAGLQHAKGDYVVIMDADLQHPPTLLDEMYRSLTEEDYDCVGTRRVSRKGEPRLRTLFAKMFYKLINLMTKTEIVDGAQDFQMMKRQVVDAILQMKEYNRFSKGIFSWVGYRVKYIEYKNVERAAGTTAWSFWSLFKYSLEGIIAFSTAPLAIASLLGIISCAIAFIMAVVIIVQKLTIGIDTSGYPTIVCLILLFGGLQLFTTGILGQYLAKTYMECKKRPVYLVQETEKDIDRQ